MEQLNNVKPNPIQQDRNLFNKIVSSGVLTYLFTYLNMSNANALLHVCKRFRSHLLLNDKKCLRLIGFYTYGLDKMIPFSKSFPLSITKTSFKSNIYPIIHMVLMQNYNYAAISPGTFENGLFIWDIVSGIYQFSIRYLDDKGDPTFVYSMCYIERLRSLLVGYSDGFVLRYEIREEKNKERYVIIWKRKIGVSKPITAMAYVIEKNLFITLECNDDIGVNFIKQYSIRSGKHIKSSIVSNCIVINMKVISILLPSNANCYSKIIVRDDNCKVNDKDKEDYSDDNDDNDDSDSEDDSSLLSILYEKDKDDIGEYYLVLSIYEMNFKDKLEVFKYNIKDTKISLTPLSQMKGDLTELYLETNLYGHTSEIKDFIYIKSLNYLLSVGIDLFIIIWDLSSKSIKHILDSAHEDIIYSITNINDDYFATCGKDRNIFVWSIKSILTPNSNSTKPIHSIAKHTSDIYQIAYLKCDNSLISGSFDKTMLSFKLSTDYFTILRQKKLTGHSSTITCAKFDYLKMEVITAGLDQCINHWDLKSMSIVKSIDIKQKEFFDDFIMLFDDINTIIKIDNSKKVKCFNTIKEEFYYTIEESSIVRSILNLYDGVSFILGLSNSEISVYNYHSKGAVKDFKKTKKLFHGDNNDPKASKSLRLKKLAYLNYEMKYIASGASDGSICVYGIDFEAESKLSIPSPCIGNKEVSGIIGLGFNKDEKAFAFTIEDTIYVYDLISKTYKNTFKIGKVLSMDKLCNGYLMISYFDSNKNSQVVAKDKLGNVINIFNVATGVIEAKMELDLGNIKPVYYMQDGCTMLAITGSPITGFSLDIIKMI